MNVKGCQFFNIDRKQDYLQKLKNKREMTDLVVAFNSIAHLEKQFNVDISDANISTLVSMLRLWEVSSYRRYQRFIKLINNYVEYQVLNGFSKQNSNLFNKAVQQVEYNVASSIFSNYLKDPDDVMVVLSEVFDSYNVNSRHIYSFAFLLLLYNGFKEQEILDLVSSDIDFDNRTVKGVSIYPQFWDVIINANKSNVVYIRRNTEVVSSDKIIKYLVVDFVKVLREELYKIKRDVPTIPSGLSLSNIRISGRWYNSYLLELAGNTPTVTISEKSDYENYKKVYFK